MSDVRAFASVALAVLVFCALQWAEPLHEPHDESTKDVCALCKLSDTTPAPSGLDNETGEAPAQAIVATLAAAPPPVRPSTGYTPRAPPRTS